jgi:type IV pilus assembly protein PilM
MELKGGTVFHNGRYEIDKKLDAGGMAVIYLASDRNLGNTKCILKIMTDDFKDVEERDYAIKKFKDEAVILARLRHPGLPVVQNHFIEEGKYCLVMDYVDGRTLEDIFFDTYMNKCLLAIDMVINWAIQICDIVDYLHTCEPMVIHRDIKPANLMENKRGRIMLLDFGVAHIFEKKRSETSIGTAGYAAPEQYLGKACRQSDIFALGATLHRLLTGYDPAEDGGNMFVYPPLEKFRDDVPEGLQDIILKATQMEIGNRFYSARELQEALLGLSEEDVHIKAEYDSSDIGKYPEFPVSDFSTFRLSEVFNLQTQDPHKFREKLLKTVGLDIGAYEIKLLSLGVDTKGNIGPKLISCRKTPHNTISYGVITDPEKLSKTVRSMIKKLHGVEVITSLSSYCTYIRTIRISGASPETVPSTLAKYLKKLIPLALEDCYIKYDILDPSGNENYMKVRVIAVKKTGYENLQKTMELSGLERDKIILEPFALTLLSGLMINDEEKKKHVIIINIGSDGTSLTLIRDRHLSQTGFFPYGGSILTKAIQSEKISYEEAEKLKRTRCEADMSSVNISEENLFHLLIPHVIDWITEISKSLKYFSSDYKLNNFDTIMFCGGGIQLNNLHTYINDQLGINSNKFHLPKNKKTSADRYDQVIGNRETAMMTAMGLVITSFKELPEVEEILTLNKINIFRETFQSSPVPDKIAERSVIQLPEKIQSCEEQKDSDRPVGKDGMEELRKYLISIVGPIGETVLEDCMNKLGYREETISTAKLPVITGMFTGKFNLSEDNILKINEKLKDIKISFIRKEYKKKNLLKELKKFLITMVGPVAETVIEDCLNKIGSTEETFTVNQLDTLIEMFSCKFNFTAEDALKIADKLQELTE